MRERKPVTLQPNTCINVLTPNATVRIWVGLPHESGGTVERVDVTPDYPRLADRRPSCIIEGDAPGVVRLLVQKEEG